MFSDEKLKAYRSRLVERIAILRKETADTMQQRGVVVLDQQSVGRLSRMDALQQQAMAQATERRRQSEIARSEAALRNLDSDEFGYCIVCGDPIGAARLDHDPALTLCIGCAKSR